jgi:hypothetical protein
VNAGSDRRRSHCLEDRVVRRHAEQAARAELARVDLAVTGVPRVR